jgi:hypothetical protein
MPTSKVDHARSVAISSPVEPATELALGLTARESSAIVAKIRPIFVDTAARYDAKKYSPDVYKKVRTAFLAPTLVSAEVLRNALRWKYGHRDKSRIPGAHKRLISEIQLKWSRVAHDLPQSPDLAFAFLNARLGGPTRFITVAFLVHLIFQERIPIIDQHNFRAVNALIRHVRPTWRVKENPSRYSDVLVVADFMASVIAAWRDEDLATAPRSSELDRFLMVCGQDIKKERHNKDLQSTAANAIMPRRG